MAERVRPAVPGSNVTDETRLEAFASLTKTFEQQRKDAEVAKTSRGIHSANIKNWKEKGIRVEPMKKVIKERFEDPSDTLRDIHEEIRLRAITNMPTIQADLSAIWNPINIPTDKALEYSRQRWYDDGAFCGRNGQARESNPHTGGSDAYDCWDRGWLNDQERIARAMRDGEKPAADASRKRPERNGVEPRKEPEVEAKLQAASRKKGAAKPKSQPRKKAGDGSAAVH